MRAFNNFDVSAENDSGDTGSLNAVSRLKDFQFETETFDKLLKDAKMFSDHPLQAVDMKWTYKRSEAEQERVQGCEDISCTGEAPMYIAVCP